MFPNPQYVVPLPARPNLEQYKKLAKDLVKVCKAGKPEDLRAWVSGWIGNLTRLSSHGITPGPPVGDQRWVKEIAEFFVRELLSEKRKCTLAGAQFVIARSHGFLSWPGLAKHLKEFARKNSAVAQFEAAADAIVAGDIQALQRLLRTNSRLVLQHSTREHGATLLHYTSANGVESYRQKTPKNIVEITDLLLKSGAEVDALAYAYGDHGDTTLGLVATSIHPVRAGVQIALMEILLEAGASSDGRPGGLTLVAAALANGRGDAAEFLAARGAKLDLEAAAGVGRLDVVQSFFNQDGSLRATATRKQMLSGFAWACEFGQTHVVEFLLQKGVAVDAKLNRGAETGLHWAAYSGHADIVQLLLERKAPVDLKDKNHNGTPLEWALHGWQSPPPETKRRDHYKVVELLVVAGAPVDRELENDKKVRSDSRMMAALKIKS